MNETYKFGIIRVFYRTVVFLEVWRFIYNSITLISNQLHLLLENRFFTVFVNQLNCLLFNEIVNSLSNFLTFKRRLEIFLLNITILSHFFIKLLQYSWQYAANLSHSNLAWQSDQMFALRRATIRHLMLYDLLLHYKIIKSIRIFVCEFIRKLATLWQNLIWLAWWRSIMYVVFTIVGKLGWHDLLMFSSRVFLSDKTHRWTLMALHCYRVIELTHHFIELSSVDLSLWKLSCVYIWLRNRFNSSCPAIHHNSIELSFELCWTSCQLHIFKLNLRVLMLVIAVSYLWN